MNSINDLVVATFSRLDMPAPTEVWESFLVKDGFFIGYKFHCEGAMPFGPGLECDRVL